MFRYGAWLVWEPEAALVYRDCEEGVGPGESSICRDSRSPFFGSKPLGGMSRIDHKLGDMTGETKQPDSSKSINSGKNGNIFATKLSAGLARTTEYIQSIILEGAKLKQGLILPSGVGPRRLFRDYNRDLLNWKGRPETLADKFWSGEITPDEVCIVNQIARDLMSWRGTNRHIADLIFKEPINALVSEYDGIRKFYDEMVDPNKVFVSDVMNFVSPVGWVSIQKKDYKRVLDFKRVTSKRLKFCLKNVPDELFSTQLKSKKRKHPEEDIYSDGELVSGETAERDSSQESSQDLSSSKQEVQDRPEEPVSGTGQTEATVQVH